MNLVLGIAMLPLLIALAIVIIGRPTYSNLLLLVAVFPLQAFGAIEAGFTIPISYVILVAILSGILLRGQGLSFDHVGSKTLALYWVIALAASAGAVIFGSGGHTTFSEAMRYRAGAFRMPLQFMLLLFHLSVFLIVTTYVRNRPQAEKVLRTHLVMGGVVCTLGVIQMVMYVVDFPLKDFTWAVNLAGDSATYEYGQVRYYSAGIASFSTRTTFFESLHFADYINSVLPIAVALWLGGSRSVRERFGMIASPVIPLTALLALFFTFSRSGWGAFVVSMLVLAILISPRLLYVHLPIAAVVASLVVTVLAKAGFFAESSLWGIITGRFDLERIIMGPRAQYFLVLWDSFKANPILGLGAGQFAIVAPSMTGSTEVHSAHGLLWGALADYGLLGFTVLFSFFSLVLFWLFRAIKKSEKGSSDRAVMTGLFSALCGLFFQSLFFGDRPQSYLVMLLGLAALYATWYRRSGTQETDGSKIQLENSELSASMDA